jgi:kynurenine formamidase
MVDVAGMLGVEMLPDSHAIGEKQLLDALKKQKTELRPGDVVLVRTGRMTIWPDQQRFVPNSPGINREGAEFLARAGAMYVGADNGGVEHTPSSDPDSWLPVHTFLLAEAGIPLLEMAYLEDLAREKVYEFAFIGACLKIRGGTGSPMRPIALPLKD